MSVIPCQKVDQGLAAGDNLFIGLSALQQDVSQGVAKKLGSFSVAMPCKYEYGHCMR